MIQITQLKLPYHHSVADLEKKIQKILKLNHKQRFTYHIVKESIDARKKPELFMVYTIQVSCEKEGFVLKNAKNPSVIRINPKKYELPETGNEDCVHKPLIIGAGPAGLFAAFLLVEVGFHPILIERGKPIEERQKDVERFWETGV